MSNSNPVQAGATISFRKTMTVAEQALFTGISGNLAPLCVDARAARAAGFDGALCFELALAALTTTCLNRIGGTGWRIGTILLDFSAALPVGSTIEASVVVTEVLPEAIRCDIFCTADERGSIMAGNATLVPLAD